MTPIRELESRIVDDQEDAAIVMANLYNALHELVEHCKSERGGAMRYAEMKLRIAERRFPLLKEFVK